MLFAPPTALYSSLLRHELNERNYVWAKQHTLHHVLTYGQAPCVIYAPDERSEHGNFLASSYREICARPEWACRLEKVFTQARASLPRTERRWRELDSAHSSDALLMNIFCHPQTLAQSAVSSLLGVESGETPVFGHRVGVPLISSKKDWDKKDRTEVDMRLGALLVEAKLTESDFQLAPARLLSRYRDLEAVFDLERLPRRADSFVSYQLIRGTLAAFAYGQSFCVFCDARRPDLIEAWYAVMQAVGPVDLRHRLKLLTWQELAVLLPGDLQHFLAEKYGIVAV